MLVLLLMRQNYPDYLNSIEKCEVEKRHRTFFVCVELHYRRRDWWFRSGLAVDRGGVVYAADSVPADR